MSEPTMNITFQEAADIVQWMEVAWDEGQGPDTWVFAERLVAAFPTLEVRSWLRKPEQEEPPPAPEPPCTCGSERHGRYVATCIQFEFPGEAQK